MTGKNKIPQAEEFGLLTDALADCASLKRYIRTVQLKISGMEESINAGVYEYADKELEKIEGYVTKIRGKILKYILVKKHGDL